MSWLLRIFWKESDNSQNAKAVARSQWTLISCERNKATTTTYKTSMAMLDIPQEAWKVIQCNKQSEEWLLNENVILETIIKNNNTIEVCRSVDSLSPYGY
jgi:hypothetical protein